MPNDTIMPLRFKPHLNQSGDVLVLECFARYCCCDVHIDHDYIDENEDTVPVAVSIVNEEKVPHHSLLSFLNVIKYFLIQFIYKQAIRYYFIS